MRCRRWSWAPITFTLAAVGCFGGNGSQATHTDGGTAKTSSTGSGANGGTVGGRDAGASSSTNPGTNTSHSDAGGTAASGSFDSLWKRAASKISLIDTADPTKISSVDVALPDTLPDGTSGQEIDAYQKIEASQLVTYAFRTGDSVYYRFARALQKADDATYVATYDGSLTSGQDTHIFTIEAGQLVDQGTSQAGTLVISTQATYTRYSGAFPPSNWPAKMVEVAP